MAVNLFDANYYRAANSDLAAAGITTNEQLLSHFQNFGLQEGRSFSPLVNLNFYRASNSDLVGMNNQQAFDHLSNFGVAEGRRFSPFVDLSFYKQVNGDLAATNFNNEQLFDHLSNYGVGEGRNFSPFVDLNFYKQVNGDLAAAGFNNKQLLEHLQSYGLNEGRQFNPAFDLNYYLEVNADLKAAKLNNSQLFEHFQFYGLTEGRVSSSAFNVKVYLANNSDLVAAGFSNQQAYMHFLMHGQKEGRSGSDYAGNSLDSARILPQSTNNPIYTDFVGLGDTKDYYRISFDHLTNASLKLDSLTDNADVTILDSTGKVIAGSLNTGVTSETINGTLEAGTYYVEVSSAGGANTNYNLTLSTENPLSKAISLGELNGTNSLEKTSTLALSANDFYRFNVKTESTVNALLDGLNGDANLQVIWDVNKNGLVDKSDAIFSSAQSGTTSEQLKGFLPAGDNYYVRVIPNAATPVDYKVTLSTVSQVATTYNYYTGSGTPDQGTPALLFDSSLGGGTQTAVESSSQLVSTTYGVAGYSKYDGGAVKLDRNKGYKLRFQVKLNSESHFGDNNGDKLDDNAGFNVNVISNDGKGIELGFWSNEIWAKNYDSASGSFALTHDSSEKATKNTTAMTTYELSVMGDNYQLFADEGSYVLSGKLRDYSGIGEKYSLSNHFFLGDNSSSAKADVNLGLISLITLDPPAA
ncbi:hypothetical protein F7734_45775 [Scytonema sp. UIC 10036]|uniref:choice-of-anchor Y domain-containing protein n=1 Tax=Scytonema sp. UIC 10036 TaxID=2304196 RepID=UPI0012DAD6BF|nr:hypothetical protein [Scytonema sp. UIC 10036]MUG99217.1 hypothetical protein [Scytonema sp. UIC 10036]